MAPDVALPGVKIKLLSKGFLEPMPSAEKIRFILDEVEQGQVLVLERGLSPMEEAQLIQATMAEIEPGGFTGIEMQTYAQEIPTKNQNWANLLRIGKKNHSKMLVIGPANTLRTVARDAHSIQAVITPAGA